MVDYREGVAIGELVCYVPALSIAILLAVRHGFGRSSGWFFLIMLSLARIIGAAMQIAIASNPTSISLYTGSAILTNTGFSPVSNTGSLFLRSPITLSFMLCTPFYSTSSSKRKYDSRNFLE
jgi:hypothetical protein